jgi:cyanophycinase
MQPFRRLCAFICALALAVSATTIAAQRPGPLYIVGGGRQPEALVRDFVQLAGGAGRARIVVMAMASADGRASGEAKAADLRALGADARNVWLTREQALGDSAARLLDGATGIWFGGGDQNRLMAVLRGTPVAEAIRARHRAGAVVGGTSAGAAVLSTPMITGEERRPAGADTTEGWTRVARGTVATVEGLGFVTNAVIDQHFVRRRRHNRLLSLVLEGPVRLGVGIDEGTALVVDPDGAWRVADGSASVVLVYDARRARITPADSAPLAGSELRLHVLRAGMRFRP